MGSDQFIFIYCRRSGLGRAPYGPDHSRWYPVKCQTWISSAEKITPRTEMDV